MLHAAGRVTPGVWELLTNQFFLFVLAADGESFRKHAPQAPRVGAHDVILGGLDEDVGI